ncbi:hypothetical protein FKW77_007801 [Venturia effusa]|uniref:Peptidase S9 prolyl oligopeptidase catalytic domain-containing protein n=1 Tax=Venturia effusa TaxID=50376 RepID=A0A517LJ81_9PEZI|nr:hypothetical protein FKW77_007801 [Venturia effusa]
MIHNGLWPLNSFVGPRAHMGNKFIFKGAIYGAGVTDDWDSLTLMFQLPWYEATLAGSASWTAPDEPKYVSAQHGCPSWHSQNTKPEDRTPILILHGEEETTSQ